MTRTDEPGESGGQDVQGGQGGQGEDRAGRIWRWFAACWLGGLLLYAALALTPVRFPYQHVQVAGDVTLDAVLHGLAFASLALALPGVFRNRLDFALGLLALALLGVATELAQFFIPQRSFALGDMAANLLGVLTGGLLGALAPRRRRGGSPHRST